MFYEIKTKSEKAIVNLNDIRYITLSRCFYIDTDKEDLSLTIYLMGSERISMDGLDDDTIEDINNPYEKLKEMLLSMNVKT